MATWVKFSVLFITTLTLQRSRAQETWDFGMDEAYEKLLNATKHKNAQLTELAQQLIINRFQDEDRIRMEGHSGFIKSRSYTAGIKNYQVDGVHSPTFMGMHDFTSTKDIIGLGELGIVMNGVQFTTRHSGYKPVQPSTTSTAWLATEPIDYPPVPESVLQLQNVTDQIAEMQEYFLAFKTNNISHRNFEPYFKPILCYIEGYWLSETEKVQDINDHTTWRTDTYATMHSMNRMNAHLGSLMDNGHRLPTLPRTIMGLTDEGVPIYAQWTYRYLCKPFSYKEIKVSNFRLVDDLQYRLNYGLATGEELFESRGARFALQDDEEGDGRTDRETLLDKLISTIPGPDNFPGDIDEKQFIHRTFQVTDTNTTYLNAAYYNRIYFDRWRDVMKYQWKSRGFSDPNLYVALTTHEEVAPLSVDFREFGKPHSKFDIRVTYMLPLEVIYLSPIQSWNPYNIVYYEGNSRNEYPASKVRENGARGTSTQPFNGNNFETFSMTPVEFYKIRPRYQSPDLGLNDNYVLDASGEARRVTGSNIRAVLGPINNGVGYVRLRYPVMPLHEDGNYFAKEFNAYRDYINKQLVALSARLKQQMEQSYA